MKKYFQIDLGFLPTTLLFAFGQTGYDQALDDLGVTGKRPNILEWALGETHMIESSEWGRAVLIVVPDEPHVRTLSAEDIGLLVHEAVHAVWGIEEAIGEHERFAEETQAYLTEHIVMELIRHTMTHGDDHARKANRKAARGKGKEGGGTEPKVDQHGDGGAGQNSPATKPASAVRGAKDGDGGDKPTTKTHVRTTRTARPSGQRLKLDPSGRFIH